MSAYAVLSHTGITAVFASHDVAMPPKLDQLQKIVGGYIEPAFTVVSPLGGHRCITGYVNEEGLLIDLPRFIFLSSVRYHTYLAGNMAIVGLDTSTGKTVTLTEDEIEWVKRHIRVISNENGYQTFFVHFDA